MVRGYFVAYSTWKSLLLIHFGGEHLKGLWWLYWDFSNNDQFVTSITQPKKSTISLPPENRKLPLKNISYTRLWVFVWQGDLEQAQLMLGRRDIGSLRFMKKMCYYKKLTVLCRYDGRVGYETWTQKVTKVTYVIRLDVRLPSWPLNDASSERALQCVEKHKRVRKRT